MNDHSRQNLVIVAGPNGAGKSTVADFLMLNRNIYTYLNADIIAKGMAAQSRVGSDITAGRVLLEEIDVSINRRESIAFESTMSGTSWKTLLKRDKSSKVDMIFPRILFGGGSIGVSRTS